MKRIANIGTESLAMLLCGLLAFPPQLVLAQPPVTSGATNTTVTSARNGVPVVNIAAPNASGLSHNTFTSYSVDANGLVLNNGDTSQLFRSSQLAGQVAANPNLVAGKQAGIILNEVTGNDRSILAGFTEVVGGKASVIVANPYGITCNGAGFINTDRVSLVTGTPTIAAGVLDSFDVRGGDIHITGTGINASAQQLLDLVSRKIAVNGQVNVPVLNVVAGTNNWNYATGATVSIASDGSAAPTYAIDSSVLGGMYAGRISLKATEAGVGVRMLGEAAATANDFIITSAGKIEMAGKLSAARDLSLTSTSNEADAIKATDANLSAGRNLDLTATSGGATLIGGGIVATGALNYTLGTLIDTASATAGIADNNKRYGDTANLSGTGVWTINGVSYGAGSSLVLAATSLSLGASSAATLYSGGDLTLDASHITVGSASDSSSRILAATSGTGRGSIINASTLDNYGVLYSGNDLDVSSASITNAKTGAIAAQRNLNVSATSGDLINWGALYAGQDLHASASWLLRNVADDTAYRGTIDAGRDMTLTANHEFLNESLINAAGNITITSPKFRNEVYDGATRVWLPETAHETVTVLGSDSLVFPGGIWEHDDSYTTTWSQSQTYRAGSLFQPQIIAGTTGTLRIQQFDSGTNMGGLLSGGTVTLVGNGGGATFTNDAMTLLERDYTHVLIQHFETDSMPPFAIPIGPTRMTVTTDSTSSTDKTLASQGAYIRANSGQLNASGFGLVNDGAPLGPAVTPNPATGAQPLTLPTNPNGMFVPSRNPNSGYLVESNPLYTNVDNYLGSDYLAEKYQFNADEVVKRLGDAAYETSLVRQQLASQAGTNLLNGYANEKEQMRGLMDHAGSQAASLGLKYGQALTADQQAGLKQDMIWMVETTVAGQKVLAPVVYLAAGTKAMFEPGNAVIAADKTNMSLTSLTNTGGTISGASSLNITTQKDIKNVSGTIKGGDVSLTSTEGSIINQTSTQTSGDDNLRQTTVGKQAGIVATGTLNVDAAKDITNLGAKMAAGGDATLTAGGQVTFDTVEKKGASTSVNLSNGTEISNVRTTDQIQSKLSSGGTLAVSSKGDITLAGTKVEAKKDAVLDAGGDLNILARESTREVITETTKSGLGVGGGVWGSEQSKTDAFKSKNVGTTITAGGDAVLSANKNVTIQGSDVKAKRNIDISGEDVKILAGKDVDRTTTTKSTLTLLTLTSGEKSTYTAEATADADAKAKASIQGVGTAQAGASSGAKAKAGVVVPGMKDALGGKGFKDLSETSSESKANSGTGITSGTGLSASANANAGLEARATMDAGGLDLSKSVVTTTVDENIKAVGSSLSGNNITITARKTATLQGAKVSAKGDVNLSGQDVKILAAEDKHTVTETSTTTKVGVYLASDNTVKGDATIKAETGAGVTSGLKGEAGAGVSASVDSGNTIDIVRTSTTRTETTDTKNVGTSLTSGGNLNINSGNKLTVQGSDITGGKDVTITAKDMEFQAGKDSHTTSTTTTDTRVGLFVDGNAKANADAGANGNYGPLGAGAAANTGAGASVEASIGLQSKNTLSNETERTTTARVSTIKSGSGSITRKAENSITDVGTSIDAAGDFSQTAKTYTSKAAADTSEKTSSTVTKSAKAGMYAGASANAEAGAGAAGGLGATADANADANARAVVGGKAAYSDEMSNESERSSTAVVSSIKAGGTVKSVTTDKTSLEGTKIIGGNAVELEAGSLDYAAAKDTSTKSSSSRTIEASGKAGAGVDATKAVAVDVELAGGIKGASSNESSSTAVTGAIASNGNISIKTTGDARLEGTKLASVGDTTVDAGGKLTYDAARDTSHKDETSYNASGSVTTSAGKNALGIGAEASGGYSKSGSDASTVHIDTDKEGNAIQNITTGGNVKVSAGKSASLEGTTIDAGGDTIISGKEGVSLNAARDTSSSYSVSANASLKLAGGTEKEDGTTKHSGSIEGSASVNVSSEKKSDATAGSIKSGGNLTIKSDKDVTLEGTELEAGNKATIKAGGSVNFKAAESTSESSGFGVNLSGKVEGETSTKKPGEQSGDTKSPASASTTKKNPGTGGTQGSDGSKKSDADLATWQKNNASVVQQLKDKQSANGKTGSTSGETRQAEKPESTTKTKSTGTVGIGIQTGKSSTKKGGSIKADSGGIEISAGGGDVNLEGTKITTSGDADISAKGNVNITAAKNTESNFGLSLDATATINTKTSNSSGTKPKAPVGSSGNSTDKSSLDTSKPKNLGTGGTQGSNGSKKSDAALATWQKNNAAVVQQIKDKQTVKDKDKAQGTTSGGTTTAKKSTTAKKAPTAVPKKKNAGASGNQSSGSIKKQGSSSTLVKDLKEKNAEAEKGAGTTGSSDDKQSKKDNPLDNMKGATGTVDINIGKVVTGTQQSDISTGGKLNISSGGKTSLTDTKVKATGGENIQAVGGTDRKTP